MSSAAASNDVDGDADAFANNNSQGNKRPLLKVSKEEVSDATKIPKQKEGESTDDAIMVAVMKEEETTTTSSSSSAQQDHQLDSRNNAATANNAKPIIPPEEEDKTSKDYYFDSYSHHAIHEEMLKDEVRTKSYEMAIKHNPHLFEGKIILDVGCGTGILSMFAAQAGAKQVYAVDCSSIIETAREIIKLNNFEDKITLIRGKIEEIVLPVPKVDLILSEWMGYNLNYESMLDSVLFARDQWLVKDGVIFPDKAVLYLCGIEDGQAKHERIDFWDDVYGFNMAPLKEVAIKEPVVDVIDAKAIVTDSVPVLTLDILTCTKEDLVFRNAFKLQSQRNDYIHGLLTYFECAFTQVHKAIGFSTAPFARYTHWKQTIFYLEKEITICNGETIEGEFACSPNSKNPRDLDIMISLKFFGRYTHFERENIKYRLR